MTYPATPVQQRFWFLERYAPDSGAYNSPYVIRFAGPLDVARLTQALRRVVARHDALRTTFAETDDGEELTVTAHVARDAHLDVPLIALDDGGAATAEAEHTIIDEIATKPFDLRRGPLVRAALLRRNEHRHVLVLVFHHIAIDRSSFGIVLAELAKLYGTNGGELAPLPTTYADYARGLNVDATSAAGLPYWRRTLAALPDPVALPADHPRRAAPSGRGNVVTLTIGAELFAGLRELGKTRGATPFMVVFAAFCVLLHRETAQDDLIVGVPVAGRTTVATQALVGPFINTLPLRARVRGARPFTELLATVSSLIIDALAHQDVPLERIVRDILTQRDPSRHPLFDVALDYRNVRTHCEWPAELRVDSEAIDLGVSRMDLFVAVDPQRSGAAICRFEYANDLFEHATIERIAGHFQRLLEGIVEDPEQHVSRLPIMTVEQRHTLLATWNQTQTAAPTDTCLHRLFESQAQRRADHVAVVQGSDAVTYRELNEKANRLARRLRAFGIRGDALVGICSERSIDAIVGILAVLKAGGAYVPFSPEDARERLHFMLADTGLSVLLTQRRIAPMLPMPDGVIVCCLDDDTDPAWTELPTDLTHAERSDGLAYVMYTSGSTGQPKGVMIEHRAAVNYVHTIATAYGRHESDRMLQFAPLTFDTSVLEIFATLATGATLVLRTVDMIDTAAAFWQACADWNVTAMTLPTAYWHFLVAEFESEHVRFPPNVRFVSIGGEAASSSAIRAWQRHVPASVPLVNGYGPTETTVAAIVYRIPNPLGAADAHRLAIGRPIGNTRAYIVSADGEPVPIGVPGELLIGGAGLARGYLGRPQLTAERFVVDRFTGSGRLYRTGDLARYRADGNVEFLGRTDRQVKVRGFRIELGEIEACLMQHPAVAAAVVTAPDDGRGSRSLAAYVVARAGCAPQRDELQSFLREKLPHYMIPAAVVAIDALPQTPHDKIDYAALPLPQPSREEIEQTEAPRTAAERKVAEIVAGLLRLTHVGRHDDFFARGGHSLLAARAIARMADAFDRDLSMRAFFAAPTIAGLASSIAAAPVRENRSTPTPADGRVPTPLSSAQRRLWLLDQLEPSAATYNVPYALRLRGDLDVAALERALAEVVRRHDVLRSVIAVVDGEPVQAPSDAFHPALRVAELAGAGEGNLATALVEESRRPFQLAVTPPIRVTLFRVAAAEHVLLVILHHIATDGWSMDVLNRELGSLYNAYRAGRISTLEELPARYSDFARRQHDVARTAAFERHVNELKAALAGAPPRVSFPGTSLNPRSSTAYRTVRVVPASLAQAVHETSRSHGTTLFTTLLAAFDLLLFAFTGQRDLVVGTAVANRTDEAFESLIGFFVNTLALRARIDADSSFAEFLRSVHAQTVAAFGRQDVPFDRLIEELHPQRDGTRTPLVNVMFVVQNSPDMALALDGIDVAHVELESAGAKFDLTVEIKPIAAGLRCSFTYRSELFAAATIAGLAQRYEQLLRRLVVQPDLTLAELLVPQRGEPLSLLSAPRHIVPLRIHERFEHQVRRKPDALAVVCGNRSLTYRELNARANRVARQLRKLDVGWEPVGLLAERSIEMVVALLGILKCGAAYLPLDVENPPERLECIVTEAQAKTVMVEQRFAKRLGGLGVQCVRIDEHEENASSDASDDLGLGGNPEDCAYVIFTSGSTGVPKGVRVPHRAVDNLVTDTNYVKITSNDVVAQASTIAFDAATFEIWGALLNGARLDIVPKRVFIDATALQAHLRTSGMTIMFVPTSLFAELIGKAPSLFATLRTLLIGGDVLQPAPTAKLFSGSPPERVLNVYGPTETTTFASFHDIERCPDGQPIPIGRPLAGVELLVLGEDAQVLPPGVPGQLFIGGAGLALGYLNDAQLTHAKFVAHPLASRGDARVYASGDAARLTFAGEIEYLGRLDEQFKWRGYRIEPREIENALRACDGVRDAKVVIREGVLGKRLVAYVTNNDSAAFDLQAAGQRLRSRLPGYMLPDAIVPLSGFPLSQNGKLDRAALPEPALSSRDAANAATPAAAPRNELETQLVALWQSLLNVAPIGATDDFFALGGHSLLAVRMFGEVERVFHKRPPLTMFFEEPTIRRLAEAILADPDEALSAAPLVTLNPRGTAQPLFFLHGSIEGGGYYCYELARHLGEEQPLHVLRPHGVADGAVPPPIPAMAADYIRQVKAAQPAGPYALGGYCSGGLVAFEMAGILRAQGDTVSNVVLIDALGPRRFVPLAARLIDGLATVARLDRTHRTALVGGMARVSHHVRRFRNSPTKRRFLQRLLARTACALASSLRIGRPAGDDSGDRPLLAAWQRCSEAYVPPPYEGSVTVLVSEELRGSPRRPIGSWDAVAPLVRYRAIPGTHFGCITEFVEHTAAELKATLAP